MPDKKAPTQKPSQTEFDRFQELTRNLLSVPKKEVNEKQQEREVKRQEKPIITSEHTFKRRKLSNSS